jgi:hypothetical protein
VLRTLNSTVLAVLMTLICYFFDVLATLVRGDDDFFRFTDFADSFFTVTLTFELISVTTGSCADTIHFSAGRGFGRRLAFVEIPSYFPHAEPRRRLIPPATELFPPAASRSAEQVSRSAF